MKAAELGADAIGLVFYGASPRAVSIEQASAVVKHLPPFITVVALFVDESEQRVREVIRAVPIDRIQFHGGESAASCAKFGKPYIKAIRMRKGIDLQRSSSEYAEAAGLLLDTHQPGRPGGTGIRFDWRRIPAELASRITLAGGLNPENVEQAVTQVRPYAVDVSGGVEQEPGVKDHSLMAAFIRGVRRGDTG